MAKYDVFLSYSRADTKRVEPLRDELRRLGYKVFFDTQGIDLGSNWRDVLREALRGSRTMVLSWSESAQGREVVTFEYSTAMALHKPILPWLMDTTPLPAMLDGFQGIPSTDAAGAAARIAPALGWTLNERRRVQMASAALAVLLAAMGLWFLLKPPPPPPPWDFTGEVTDRVTQLPIAGVEVDATEVNNGNNVERSASTNSQGQFDVSLPPPRPDTIVVRFRKDGYEGESPSTIRTGKFWSQDMVKLP